MITAFDYFLFGILGILLVFSLAIGIEKMIKLIIGNYLLMIISLALNCGIEQLIVFLKTNTNPYLGEIKNIYFFLTDFKTGIILTTYLILLIIIFTKSKITIGSVEQNMRKYFMTALLAPLTIVSIFVSLEIVIYGSKLIIPGEIINLANNFQGNIVIQNFITLTPLWIIVPGLVTIMLSTEIKFPSIKFNFRKKKEEEKKE